MTAILALLAVLVATTLVSGGAALLRARVGQGGTMGGRMRGGDGGCEILGCDIRTW